MRWLLLGVSASIALAGCSKASDGGSGDAGPTATSAPSLAFAYSYTFRLPSARVADAQERHAQACERLGAARCRIIGMTYTLDADGAAQASLGVALAAPIARAFGRDGIAAIEAAGGALTGAEITGTDTAPTTAEAEAARTAATAERTHLDRELARPGLTPPERAELLRERAALAGQANVSAGEAATQRASVTFTPVSFQYRAGSGVGVSARLADAWALAQSSLVGTLSVTLTLLAAILPPALLLLLVLLLWHSRGRLAWARLWRERDATPG